MNTEGNNPTAILQWGSARLSLCSLRSLAANFGFRVSPSLSANSRSQLRRSSWKAARSIWICQEAKKFAMPQH